METNSSENFESSVISSSLNTSIFSPLQYQYLNTEVNEQRNALNVVNRATKSSKSVSTNAAKHKSPMHWNRQTGGSIGVSVITTPLESQAPVKEYHKPQFHLKQQQQQHVSKGSFLRSLGDASQNNGHMGSSNISPQSSGVTSTPFNSSYVLNKSKSGSVSYSVSSIVQSHTQNLASKYFSNKYMTNANEEDIFLHDDEILPEIFDKRAQYSYHLPVNYQHVLQDHSYSQLPESPPPSSMPQPPVQQKTSFNGLSGISASAGSSKVTLNNKISSSGFSPLNTNSNRLNNQGFVAFSSSFSSTPNNISGNVYNNVASSVITVNPKKNLHSHLSNSALAHIPKGLLKTCGLSDKPEESDLSEDDRLLDPHGEETETAPEAEAEEESVTRCVCDYQHDDGYMISCDRCLAWQHVDCMGIDWHSIPDEYQCEKCQPRYVDKKRAIEIQKKKIQDKLCVGLDEDSDSSDTPANNSRNSKTQTKRKYKGKRGTTGPKRKYIKETKEINPRKNLGAKKRLLNDWSMGLSPPNSPMVMTAEKKKQLLIERKQILLEKKHMTKKKSMRKQTQNSKRNLDKIMMDNDYESNVGSSADRGGDCESNIHQVREWVDRYEEAVTNHYSQELRARLNASQINGLSSDLKFTASLRSVEKCRTSLLSTGGKIVLATSSLSPNQPIIELRGKYMFTGAKSFKQSKISQFTSYVFYYKLTLPKQDIEICVDCRSYGNFARFVRRSCKPNAELRHCIRKTSVHLYIIATQSLKKNSEILIGHYSPETANNCVCGSFESCTAANTPYPTFSKANDKLKESQVTHSSAPMSIDAPRSKKTPSNTDKNKKLKDEKIKLTKEKRRGRRKSPLSGSNSDEFSSRDQSPAVPVKLTISLWNKPATMLSPTSDVSNKTNSDNERQADKPTLSAGNTAPSNDVPKITSDGAQTSSLSPPSVNNNPPFENTVHASPPNCNTNSINTKNTNCSATVSENSTSKQSSRNTRQSDYAKKEKHQLDMPLFFQTPNNHKMTREEKKIQAIMRAFEAMEKSEAKRQESQKHRRDSIPENDIPVKKNGQTRKSLKNRRNTENAKSRYEDGRTRENSQAQDDDSQDKEGGKENTVDNSRSIVKNKSKSDDMKTVVLENSDRLKDIKVESKYDENEHSEDGELEDEEREGVVPSNKKGSIHEQIKSRLGKTLPEDDKSENETDNESCTKGKNEKTKGRGSARHSPTTKLVPKARAVLKPRVARGKKRKSESNVEASPDMDVDDSTRRAVLRQRRSTPCPKNDKFVNDAKNSISYSLGKFRKVEESAVSPFSTPPKLRERLDSSSSSGGTPPTPVSDTCLLVASAIGHLTDFKFPNTKKELMNAWFKEERKPDDENLGKQEGNNECAKKRWLRQAISEEGDNSLPRPEEPNSPNGDYGGPLKKRRFAREGAAATNSFGTLNEISFDDEDEVSSPEVTPFPAVNEIVDVATCHPTSFQDSTKLEKPSILFRRDKIEILRVEFDEEIAKVASESVADTIASILAPVNAQLTSPPRPPSVPPPLTPSPPPDESTKSLRATQSPLVSKKKLSLTEYQQRKGATTITPITATFEPICDIVQELPALVDAMPPVNEADSVKGRPSSRISVTSSSGSDREEEDNSHVASAEVIARSLMLESRHLPYGVQASALYNSLRSGTNSTVLNSKTATSSTSPVLRENLAERLKREFDVHVQEDATEKNKVAQLASPSMKTLAAAASVDMTHFTKDLQLKLKKGQPPPPPPPLPNIPPPLLPPLPEAPRLFAASYYPYQVPQVAPFFAAPPPPPPPRPPSSVTRSSIVIGPPPPPPPSAK